MKNILVFILLLLSVNLSQARIYNNYTTVINEDVKQQLFNKVDKKIEECLIENNTKCKIKFESKELREFVVDYGSLTYKRVSLKINQKDILINLKKVNECVNELLHLSIKVPDTNYLTISENQIKQICLSKTVKVKAIYKNKTALKQNNRIDFTENVVEHNEYPSYYYRDMKDVLVQKNLLLKLEEYGFNVIVMINGFRGDKRLVFIENDCDKTTGCNGKREEYLSHFEISEK